MTTTDPSYEMTHDECVAELRELVARAKAGDVECLPRLRQFLDQNPILWQGTGDLAVQSQLGLIKLAAGGNKHLQMCITRKVAARKKELLGPSPTPLEQLLVERIVTTEVQVNYLDLLDSQQQETSLRWAEFQLKRLDRAHNRHLKSIAALEMLRKLVPSRAPAADADQSRVVTTTVTEKQEAREVEEAANGSHPKVNGHNHNRLTAAYKVSELAMAE